ncbi:MAG: RNA-binding domain-containing protein [Cellulomonas sp.]
MTTASDALALLVGRLCRQPAETEWVEFKENNADPNSIGEYISALSNAATLNNESTGYLVWGVRDSDHVVVGTSFDPEAAKVGNEGLEPWLHRLLAPSIFFRFERARIGELSIVVLRVDAAIQNVVRWKGEAFIRIGPHTKKLKAAPDRERRMWAALQATAFEGLNAVEGLREDEVTDLLYYPAYFELMRKPLPEGRRGIIDTFRRDNLIHESDSIGWDVTNAAAVLLARDLSSFPHLARKAPRVVMYNGTNRVSAVREQTGTRGYAAGFEGLLGFINGLLPEKEMIGQALRSNVPVYPELAVRELVVNALLHQDFTVAGAGPMVEIFDHRIEITNPGVPLLDLDRFIDAPPRSRNSDLGRYLHRMSICEERGSGWDKVTFEVEAHQLPAPLVEIVGSSTRATLFGPQELRSMERSDRLRAVYQHACLRYVSGDKTSNSSIRARFGISDRNSARASRLLSEGLDAGLIRMYDTTVGAKARKYGPYWAFEDGLPERS